MRITKIFLGIFLTLVVGIITTLLLTQEGVIVNMIIAKLLIYSLAFGIFVDLVWLLIVKLQNPINLDVFSKDGIVCKIRVYNLSKHKKLEDCWCKVDRFYYYNETTRKYEDATRTKNQDNIKFLWNKTGEEVFTIHAEDHDILNIAQPKRNGQKVFIELLHPEPETFEVAKNKDGHFEQKLKIRFKIMGKKELGMKYFRSVTKEIILKTDKDELGEKLEPIVYLHVVEDKYEKYLQRSLSVLVPMALMSLVIIVLKLI